MKIKFSLIFFFVCIGCFFSGCSPQQQIHQKLIIQGIAIDTSENDYTITVQALDFQNPATEEEPNIKMLEIKGKSLVESLENISKHTNLIPVYSQNLIVIIGEEVALSGMNNFIDFFVRHFETRPKVKICVTKGKASEIFKIKYNGKFIKAKNLHDLIPEELNSDILHFVSNLKNNFSDPYAAWLEVISKSESSDVCLKGVVIFNGDILKEFISEDKALGFMVLKGVPGFEACSVKIDDFQEVTCLINQCVSKNNVIIDGNTPRFNINLDINVSVFAFDKKLDAYFDENIKLMIKNSFSSKINNLCDQTICECLNLKCDVFGWGRVFKNSYPQHFKNIEDKWKEYIRKSKYNISSNVNVTITGKEVL